MCFRALNRRSTAAAFTIVELLVLLSIIGVLIAVLVPAVQSAREAARRVECSNHLKNIGLATLQHHEAVLAFPPARLRAQWDYGDNACESTQPSWLVRILPFLEESAAASQWDHYATFESHDASLREHVPESYVCPTRRRACDAVIPSARIESEIVYPCGCSDIEIITLTSGAVGDYGGNHGDYTGGSYGDPYAYWRGGNGTGVIISSRPRCQSYNPTNWVDKVRMKDIVDGASYTALSGEMHVPFDRLAQYPENGPMYNGKDLPAFARIGGPSAPLARGGDDNSLPVIGFGSWHPGVCPFVLADGSVQIINNFVESDVLRSLCRRNDEYELTYDFDY